MVAAQAIAEQADHPALIELRQTTLDLLEQVLDELTEIREHGQLESSPVPAQISTRLRRVRLDVTTLAQVPVTVLAQFSKSDARQTQLLRRLSAEMDLDDVWPVACASTDLDFLIWPTWAIMVSPFVDRAELIAWPIMAHELGHVIFDRHASKLVAKLKVELGSYAPPEAAEQFRERWENWANEFVADWIGAHTFGPAYLQMLIEYLGFREEQPGDPPSRTHPPLEDRIKWVTRVLPSDDRVGQLLKQREQQVQTFHAGGVLSAGPGLLPPEFLEALERDLVDTIDSIGLVPWTTAPEGGVVGMVTNGLANHDRSGAPFADHQQTLLLKFGRLTSIRAAGRQLIAAIVARATTSH